MENNTILIYQAEDGKIKIETRLENETVWLTQEQMAQLFQRERSVITKHLKNIFEEQENLTPEIDSRTLAEIGSIFTKYNLPIWLIFVLLLIL